MIVRECAAFGALSVFAMTVTIWIDVLVSLG